MRKLLLFIFLFFSGTCIYAQVLTLQQKLFYTCKVWGYVKYYHSNVSVCHVNWDSVLLHTLPLVRNAANDSEFNDALDTLLAAAGTMAIATTPPLTPLPPELRRNLNFGWFHDTLLRNDVSIQLDTIRNNFRPHSGCYVLDFCFPMDTPLLKINTITAYPDSNHRQLMLFKYWNIINYFNPYNYVLDKPIDSLLFNNLIPIDTVTSPSTLFIAIRKITAGLNDAHVGSATYSDPLSYSYWYLPKLMLRYIEGKYVVVKSGISYIPVGSSIVSVGGSTITQMEDSMKKYVSAGNISVFRRFMYKYLLLGGTHSSTFNLVFAHATGAMDSTIVIRNTLWGDPFMPEYYYPADSLANIHWATMDCGIGYMNAGNMTIADADSAYAHLRNAPAIIIDSRNYPTSNFIYELENLMYASPQMSHKMQIMDPNYPGTYYWFNDSVGVSGNTTPYLGTIILIFNEESQSAAEVSPVSFEKMPHVIKIGSQTAGACGASLHFNFTRDIYTAFTVYSLYYPNGDSLQRIGVVPDSVVKPTVAGIMAGRDEVVEKALQIGCLLAEVPKTNDQKTSIHLYPNPANDIINISTTSIRAGKITIQIQDVFGSTLIERSVDLSGNLQKTAIDLQSFCTGVYIVRIKSDSINYTEKLTIQH